MCYPQATFLTVPAKAKIRPKMLGSSAHPKAIVDRNTTKPIGAIAVTEPQRENE